jgi:hypothetical protein
MATFVVNYLKTGDSKMVEYYADGLLHITTKHRVGCNSSSMGLTLRCGDILDIERYDGGELEIGRIYTYQDGNESIVHRIVACQDKNCNLVIFKGDNNQIAEFVNKTQITGKVLGVEYR